MSLKANLSTEAVIRAAKSDEWANADAADDGALISVGDTTLRHTEVETTGGGASRLSKNAIGSSALRAALTLHPCVHISGCGDASVAVLETIFSQVGACRISRILDDDGCPQGEASATYESADAAAAAIEKFDGQRFDDGVLHVTVSKRSTQGSLTTRGRGRGKGRDGFTFHDRQQDLISKQSAERAQAERDAFATARAASLANRSSGAVAGPALPSRQATQEPVVKKMRTDERSSTRLPSCLAVQKYSNSPAATGQPSSPKSANDGAGLLGLANYESDSEGE